MKRIITKISLVLSLVVMGVTNLAYAGGGTSTSCFIAGPANAAVTIEEFADFECKYCAKGSRTMREVLKNYAGKVNLVFRNMPLASHSNALAAAKAFSAVCLQSSSLAYSFQKELFDNQEKLAKEGEGFLYEAAEKLGVNVAQMKSDMNGEIVAKSISEDQQLAQSHNFKGTPSFMIGLESVVGALDYDEIKKLIDKQLAQ